MAAYVDEVVVLDELGGDVLATLAVLLEGEVAAVEGFPVAVRRVRVGGGRRGVRDACRGHNAH